MIPFQGRPGARLICQTDFTHHSAANLNFHDAGFTAVPLHVSLRQDEGLLVLNRRDAAGWRRELHFAPPFPQTPSTLDLRFGRFGVAVHFNGQRIAWADAWPRASLRGRFGLRRGFPGLSQIVGLTLEGGFAPETLTLSPRPLSPGQGLALEPGQSGLRLSPRFELTCPEPGPLPLPDGSLLDLHPLEGGGFGAALPARIWLGLGPNEGLHIGGLTISRADLRARLVEGLLRPNASGDDFLALQLIAHCARSSSLNALPPPAQRQVLALAETFRLTALLSPQVKPAAPPLPLPPVPPRLPPETTILALLRHHAGRDPGPALIAALEGAEGVLPVDLLLRVTESAFQAGLGEGLLAAGKHYGLHRLAPGTPPLEAALQLPYAAAQGLSPETLAQLLTRLSNPRLGWIATAPLAWACKTALHRPSLRPTERRQLLRAWMGFHESLSAAYFSRHSCRRLMEVSASLLRLELPAAEREELEAHWLRCCSLSPSFYRALQLEAPEPLWPEALRAAATAFRALRSSAASPQNLASPLTELEAWQNPAAPRFRRGLLGPSGLPWDPLSGPSLAGPPPSGEAVLRHLLAPQTAPTPQLPEALVAAAGKAVPDLWLGVSPLPFITNSPSEPQKEPLSGGVDLNPPGGAFKNQALQRPSEGLSGHTPDLLVAVVTCEARLESHLPGLRNGWLSALTERGIPWIAVTGGGSGAPQLEGQHLRLPCPDDYEGLPQKTLALLAWFQRESGCAHLLKVDDDVVFDVPEVLKHLHRADYIGRRLSRLRGETERDWHHPRSQSPRGRYEIDLSPEPSVYADGGSGYLLSRRAVNAALDQAQTPAGRWLTALSFLEDKLVGDLLSRAGISLAPSGWYVAREERVGRSDLTRPAWGQAPRPFRGSGITGVHLDHPDLTLPTHQSAAANRPRKDRIWPSYLPARFGWATNGLTLLSAPDRLAKLAGAEVSVISTMRNERPMLPHFLAHYRALGVESFLIADNGSTDGTTEYLAAQPDVALFHTDTPYRLSHYGVDAQEALLSNLRQGRWSLVADADEFLVWDETTRGNLPKLLRSPAFEGADAARVFMLDMYPKGPLSTASFTARSPFEEANCADLEPFLMQSGFRGPFSDTATFTSGLRHRLMPGNRPELFVAQKMALLRWHPAMQLTEGLHYVSGVTPAKRELIFAHFKYTAWFQERVQREVARGEHFNNAEEYRRYQALLQEGREVLFEEGKSGHWTKSAFIRHLFAGQSPPHPGDQTPAA